MSRAVVNKTYRGKGQLPEKLTLRVRAFLCLPTLKACVCLNYSIKNKMFCYVLYLVTFTQRDGNFKDAVLNLYNAD